MLPVNFICSNSTPLGNLIEACEFSLIAKQISSNVKSPYPIVLIKTDNSFATISEKKSVIGSEHPTTAAVRTITWSAANLRSASSSSLNAPLLNLASSMAFSTWVMFFILPRHSLSVIVFSRCFKVFWLFFTLSVSFICIYISIFIFIFHMWII